MTWRSATSLDELKKIGTFRDVKSSVKKDIESFKIVPGVAIKFTPSSWPKLWDAIVQFKKIESALNPEKKGREFTQTDTGDTYFRGRKERFIFSLLELEGEDRNRQLGLGKKHLQSKTAAKKWMREIASVIHPDKNDGSPQSEKATQKLNDLYNLITS